MRRLTYIWLLVVVGMVLFSSVAQVIAVDYIWTNSDGGTFDADGNWNIAGWPGNAGDSAKFNLASAYTVQLNSNVTNNNIMEMEDGVLTFNTGTNTYGATTVYLGRSSAEGGTLILTNGTVESVGATYVGDRGVGTLVVSNGATLNVGGYFGVKYTRDGTTSKTGMVIVTGAGSTINVHNRMYINPYNANSNDIGILRVLNGGHLNRRGSDGNSYFDAYSQVEVDGAGSVLSMTNTSSAGPWMRYGGNSLSITRGGKIYARRGRFDYASGNTETVLIDGSGSEFVCSGWIGIDGHDAAGSGPNTGPLDVTIRNGARMYADIVHNWTNATITLSNGTIECGHDFLNKGGVIQGDGSITVGSFRTVQNRGTFRPGTTTTAGVIAITNDTYRQYSTREGSGAGTLEINIGGTNAATEYDLLMVDGAVSLTDPGNGLYGTITLDLINGYEPPVGVTTYDVITADSITPADLAGVVFNMPFPSSSTWTQSVVTVTGGEALRITATTPPPTGTAIIIR